MNSFRDLLWLGLLICVFSVNAYGQQADTLANFKTMVRENHPRFARNLSFLFVPIYVQGYAHNPNAGFALGVAYRHREKYTVSADFIQAWGSQLGDRKQESRDPFKAGIYSPGGYGPGGWPVGGSKPYREISLAGTYYLKKFMKSKDIDVREAINDTLYFTDVIQQPRLHWYGARAGLSYIRTWIQDSEIYTFYDTTSSSVQKGVYLFGTMMHLPMISLGVSRGNIFHTAYEVNDFGRHYVSGSTEFYGDVFFAPHIWLSDINLINEEQLFQVVNLTDQMGNFPFGFRVGAMRTELTPVGFNLGFEAGFRPGKGYWTDNHFLLLKAWFNFSTYTRKFTDQEVQ